MRINKRNRLKVYNSLLRKFKVRLSLAKKSNLFFIGGICEEIKVNFICAKDGKPYTIEDFPELINNKPSEVKSDKLWWRNDTIAGIQSRIELLKRAKQLCQNKNN